MYLHTLKAPAGANKKRKRVGRGESSGHGKTAGRGGKGQTARTGKGKPGRGFEGGQMPMFRRMPKRGFSIPFPKKWAVVNLDMLATHFRSGASVDLGALVGVGLGSKNMDGVRVLGRGELPHPLTVTANHFSASAKQKIEAAGGKAIEIEKKPVWKRPEQAQAKA